MKKIVLLILLLASQLAFANRLPDIVMTTAGNSAALLVGDVPNPVNLTLALAVTGTVDVTVQYAVNSAATVWYSHADLTARTANSVGTIVSPVSAIRLVYNSGTGSATLSVLQAGTAK